MPADESGPKNPYPGQESREFGVVRTGRTALLPRISVACAADEATLHTPCDAAMTYLKGAAKKFWIKKSPLMKAGLKLFSWRRIVETGVIMLRRRIYV
jgi:hypothetical protein